MLALFLLIFSCVARAGPVAAGDFYGVVVSGTTYIGLAGSEPSADALQRRQDNNVCAYPGNPDGQVGCQSAYIDSAGQTVIADPAGTVTLPKDASDPITTTLTNEEPATLTITPSDLIIETTDSAGHTVFSNADTAVTVPTGITTSLETVLPNGDTTVLVPPPVPTRTTVSEGQTIISIGESAITLPSGVTTPIETVLPNSETTTIVLESSQDALAASTIITDGLTIISVSQGAMTLPTGSSAPIETVLPGGESTTIVFPEVSVSATSSDPLGTTAPEGAESSGITIPTTTTSGQPSPLLFPITTSVAARRPTDDGIVRMPKKR